MLVVIINVETPVLTVIVTHPSDNVRNLNKKYIKNIKVYVKCISHFEENAENNVTLHERRPMEKKITILFYEISKVLYYFQSILNKYYISSKNGGDPMFITQLLVQSGN